MATVKLLNWEFCSHREIIELKISWPPWNYWIEDFMATAKLLLNWDFCSHSQIIELRTVLSTHSGKIHCHSQILNSVVGPWQPNSQFSTLVMATKFSIQSFGCGSQIFNSIIWLGQPNPPINNLDVAAKLSTQYFGCGSQIINSLISLGQSNIQFNHLAGTVKPSIQ